MFTYSFNNEFIFISLHCIFYDDERCKINFLVRDNKVILYLYLEDLFSGVTVAAQVEWRELWQLDGSAGGGRRKEQTPEKPSQGEVSTSSHEPYHFCTNEHTPCMTKIMIVLCIWFVGNLYKTWWFVYNYFLATVTCRIDIYTSLAR